MDLIRLDTMQGDPEHRHMTRRRLTVSYDPEALGVNLEELLGHLQKDRGSVYFGRSIADIAGLVLAEELVRLSEVRPDQAIRKETS